jgi:hypothetical protein
MRTSGNGPEMKDNDWPQANLLDANGIPNKPIRCDGLIGAHTQYHVALPLASL